LSHWKIFVIIRWEPFNKGMLISGVTSRGIRNLQQNKYTKHWLGSRLFLNISNGFGNPHVKQDTNSSSGFYFMTDWTQGTCLEERTSQLTRG
jgi:hypothetical protein